MFTVLVANIFPLYLIIALGFLAGKRLNVHLESTASLAIFILTPVVIFGAITKLELEAAYLLLPVIVLLIGGICAVLSYKLSQKRFKDITPNLIGMATATGNTGYFGFPVMLSLFGEGLAGVYLLMNLGIILIENTCGYFIGARGHADAKQAFMKAVKLPALHATWIGLLINVMPIDMPFVFYVYWDYFYGAWIVIGMMLIGIALSKVQGFRINAELLAWLFGFKFVVWPLLMIGFVMIDKQLLGLFDETIHILLVLLSATPLASNIVAFAAHLNLRPSEAATAVLLSTIFALFFIPFVLSYFL